MEGCSATVYSLFDNSSRLCAVVIYSTSRLLSAAFLSAAALKRN
jgi:hypothetical protein